VELVVRNVNSRHYLGEDGFSPTYQALAARLSDAGKAQSDWQLETRIPAGQYWLSARAVDGDGNEDPVVPTAFFSVVEAPYNPMEKPRRKKATEK